MKYLLPLITFFLGAFTVYFAFKPNKWEQKVIAFNKAFEANKLDKNFKNSVRYIPTPQGFAENIVANYQNNVIPLLNKYDTSTNNTTSIWIPLKDILGHLRSVDLDTIDGMRFYLSRYNQEDLKYLPIGSKARAKYEAMEKERGGPGSLNKAITMAITLTYPFYGKDGALLAHRDTISYINKNYSPYDISEICPPPICEGEMLPK